MAGTNRRTGKAGEPTDSNSTPNVNPQAAQSAGGQINDTLMSMSVALKDSMKQVVVPQAFMLLMEDFASGDYGDLTPVFSQALTRGMCAPLETQYQRLLQGTTAQPVLPASSGELTGTSSSTC